MRDLERINRIMNLIRRIWKKNPDLRLCQLIENCFDTGLHNGNLYYVEDKELENIIREVYKKELE